VVVIFCRKSLWEKWTVQVKSQYFFQTVNASSVVEKDAELQEETVSLVEKLVEA
jgi:hypothetical protein